jgi:hypothetical protein
MDKIVVLPKLMSPYPKANEGIILKGQAIALDMLLES